MLSQVDERFFDLAHWQGRGALRGTARGRGEASFIDTPVGEVVLRHYRRGGLPGRFIRDWYLWPGLEATRPWREWRLTARLFELGLPVPQPLAAYVQRAGLGYRADLVTRRLAHTESLAARLGRGALEAAMWEAVGRCIRRFHAAGLDHADLNAHNILIDADDRIYLIDFDRGRLRQPGSWTSANLARLQRSLQKLKGLEPEFAYTAQAWQALMAAYRA